MIFYDKPKLRIIANTILFGGEKVWIVHLRLTKLPTLESLTSFFSHYPFRETATQIIVYLIYIMAAWIILAVIFRLVVILRHLKEPMVFLEITPPLDTKIDANSTVHLFNLVSNLLEHRSFFDRLLLRQATSSFEIVSSKKEGVKYFVRLPKSLANTFAVSLKTYTPQVKIQESVEYLQDDSQLKKYKIVEYKLARHFALPLTEHQDLKMNDPIAYLTDRMSHLQSDDLLAIQIVLKPMNDLEHWLIRQKISKIKTLIRQNMFLGLDTQNTLNAVADIIDGISRLVALPLLFVGDIITGNNSKLPDRIKAKPTPATKEMELLVKAKLSEPLLGVNIRALLVMNKDQLNERARGLSNSFSSYRHESGQSIVASKSIPFGITKRISYWLFKKRIGNSKLILSTSEIAALYHFPFETNPESSDLRRARCNELPAPLSFRQDDGKFDVTFGTNNFGGESVPIGLTLEQRQKHMYLIGKTGMGKTTLLKNAIYQDMVSGKGLAVLDPHGDLHQELLSIIPENRRKDVIVFDPSDREWPIGLNILSPGVHFADKEDEQEWITSSLLAVFAKITAKEYWGPRMEHILKNATLTALQTENPSLYTLQQLLTDKVYQKKVAAGLKDPVLKQFWNKEFALLGKMQLSSVTAPLTQRLGSFITTKMSRHILLQEKSTISISRIMNEGKILLVNLSKGDLGEDQSFFFGVVLTSLIWMAAYQRTKIPEKDRRDFFLYVDEFQNFATPRFSEITSEGRKFHVSLIASHQNIAQVEDQNILKVVAGNANSIVCLKASPDDENFILPFMEPEVEKGDIVNLAPFHFFMKVANDNSENAFSGVTVPLDIEPNEQVKTEVVDYSRNTFSTPRKTVEEYLDKLFTGRLADNSSVAETANPDATVKIPEKAEAQTMPKVTKKPKIKRMK